MILVDWAWELRMVSDVLQGMAVRANQKQVLGVVVAAILILVVKLQDPRLRRVPTLLADSTRSNQAKSDVVDIPTFHLERLLFRGGEASSGAPISIPRRGALGTLDQTSTTLTERVGLPLLLPRTSTSLRTELSGSRRNTVLRSEPSPKMRATLHAGFGVSCAVVSGNHNG